MNIFQNFAFSPGVLERIFGGPGIEKSDFEESGVASLEPEPSPREERERRAGSWEGSRKPLYVARGSALYVARASSHDLM